MKMILAVLAIVSLSASPSMAHDWYAAPNGQRSARGTTDDPFDITSALDGSQSIRPGDTLWIEPGVYHRQWIPLTAPNDAGWGFPMRLAGTAEAPIEIRGIGRATIDGGLAIIPPATHLIVRDLEITTLQPRPDAALSADPNALTIPWGGLNIFTGDGCKYIDLVVHDNCQGISFWQAATDSEVYGCLIYRNGWRTSPDPHELGHGHALYLQNNGKTGRKTVANCYFGGGIGGYSLHAYGEGGPVENISVDQNVFDEAHNALVGGKLPSYGIEVSGNDFYHTSLEVGWSSPYNRDCKIVDNTMLEGRGNELDINNFVHTVLTGNTVVGWGANVTLKPNYKAPEGDTWSMDSARNIITDEGLNFMGFPGGFHPPVAWKGLVVHEIRPGYIQLGGHGTKPDHVTVHIRPDQYDANRALLSIFDWTHPGLPQGTTQIVSGRPHSVSVDLSGFLSKGDHYRLLDPRDFYGKPVQSGVFDGNPVSIDVPGDFRALMIVKNPPQGG
ncbi:MAG TPA: hypothetical protein VFJ58_24405 [Armatimonadota bacterium]|nr:hypothetical protein [Armatimonadota bacterium]